MARKKTEYTPKIIFYADKILLQMGFVNDADLGFLIRILTYHAMGMEKEADALLADCTSDMIKLLYAEHCQIIDNDNQAYKDKCEKNKQIAIEREERRRHEGARTCTNVDERHLTNTNTKSNTNSSKEESIIRTHEDDLMNEAWGDESWREAIAMNHRILSPRNLQELWNTFVLDCKASDKAHADVRDVKDNFNKWLNYKLKVNGTPNTNNAASNEQRDRESQARKADVAARIAARLSGHSKS